MKEVGVESFLTVPVERTISLIERVGVWSGNIVKGYRGKRRKNVSFEKEEREEVVSFGFPFIQRL